jgi:phenylpyruvate tautomerase PptA (4-oxalocrotonate tautomerase family)
MPIVDIEMVCSTPEDFAAASAAQLASALGEVFKTPAGRTWVRLHLLQSSCYAENDAPLSPQELPVFVTVLHAHPPQNDARAKEVMEVTRCIASCVERPPERVHVQYEPAAAGRQAFGGRLVQ